MNDNLPRSTISEAARITATLRLWDESFALAVRKTPGELLHDFSREHVEFRECMQRMATAANMPPVTVYRLWLDYVREAGAMPTLIAFIERYHEQLGGDVDRLNAATRKEWC